MKLFSRSSLLISALSTLLGLVSPQSAQAQFLGYTSPQSVQQTLATNLQCTGAAQNFNVSNLGQTQHFVTVAGSGNTFLSAEIDGVDSQGNVTRISDILKVPSTSPTGALFGSGYYPIVRVSVICSSNTGSTFTLSYSGTSGANTPSVGGFQTSQIDKLLFTGQAANANASTTFQTPFGNSTGTIYFVYSAAPGFSTTLTASCGGIGLSISTTTFTLANSASVQAFAVSPTACPNLTLNYVTGGATAATFTMEYVFGFPGTLSSSIADPCQLSGFAKSSAPINAAAAATTQIVALVSGSPIYVCGYQVSQIAAAGTLQWKYGTGASCGTGTTNLTGAMGVTASQPIFVSGPGTVFTVPSSNALCLATTGVGGTASGVVSYVQSGAGGSGTGGGSGGGSGGALNAGPFSGTGAGAGWTGPTNTATINAVYATCTIPAGGNCTSDLYISGLGFAIPAGATINGITVTVVGHCSGVGGCTGDNTNGGGTSLTKVAGTAIGTSKNSVTLPVTTDSTQTLGGSSDLWGTTWTPADINAAGFGVTVNFYNLSSFSRIASVDYLAITVTYTPAP